jgi:hypothetical protein
MRLRIFGIPKTALFCVGFLPAVLWLAFHPWSLLYRSEEFYWVLGAGFMTAVGFTALFRSGWFRSRYFVYGMSVLVLVHELVRSVVRRDFPAMGGGILCLGVLIAVGLWLERRVASASLNPECFWFEGEPLMMNQVEASVKLGEESYPARVRRIDSRGLFLFLDPPVSFRRNQIVEVWLRSGKDEVEGQARIQASFHGGKTGLGLQFLSKDLYHFSRYTALVQQLRGRGL